MRTDLYLEDPVITRAMRTGYGYSFMESDGAYCDECGERIDEDDLDAFVDLGRCVCGRCWHKYFG